MNRAVIVREFESSCGILWTAGVCEFDHSEV